MKSCPKCNSLFDPGKWNKRFCSRRCANSRKFSAAAIEKKSKAGIKFYSKLTREERVQLHKEKMKLYDFVAHQKKFKKQTENENGVNHMK